MSVAIDEAGCQHRIRKMQGLRTWGRRNVGVWADGRDPSLIINENGAVGNRRRRHGMDRTGADAEDGRPSAYGVYGASPLWTGQSWVGSVPG